MNITSKEESEALYNSQCCFLPKRSSLLVLSLQKKKQKKREKKKTSEEQRQTKIQVKNKDKQK